MMAHTVKPNQPHSHALAQDKQYKLLQSTADQLKSLHDRLQAERQESLQQHHLLSCYAELLGHVRLQLQDDDTLLFVNSEGLEQQLFRHLLHEQQLIQQLTGLDAPQDTHNSSCHSAGGSSNSPGHSSCSSMSDSDCCSDGNASRQPSGFGKGPEAHHHHNHHNHHNHSHHASTHPSILQQLQEPVAPADDPFMLMRLLYDQGVDEVAASVTFQDLQALWRQEVRQLEGHLQEIDAAVQDSMDVDAMPAQAPSCSQADGGGGLGGGGGGCSQRSPTVVDAAAHSVASQQERVEKAVEGIKEIQMRFFHMCFALFAADKCHLFFEMHLVNWETGERLQEPCKQRHAAAVCAMQLTPAQKQRLVMCWKCFQRLLEPIVAERQQLHMQGVAIPELVQGMQGVKLNQEEQQKDEQAKAGAGPRQLRQQSGGGSSSSGLQTSAAVADQGTRLQSQVEQYVRLRMLTRKDNMLRQHFAALFHGCLSWVQQARMRVCMSPYAVNAGILFVALLEDLKQQKMLQQKILQQQARLQQQAQQAEQGAQEEQQA